MMRLSTREQEVLAGIVRGLPSKAIAAELGLSLGSVKIYVGRILWKLRARNRTEAAVMTLQAKR